MHIESDDHSTMSGGGCSSDSKAMTPQCQAEHVSDSNAMTPQSQAEHA